MKIVIVPIDDNTLPTSSRAGSENTGWRVTIDLDDPERKLLEKDALTTGHSFPIPKLPNGSIYSDEGFKQPVGQAREGKFVDGKWAGEVYGNDEENPVLSSDIEKALLGAVDGMLDSLR